MSEHSLRRHRARRVPLDALPPSTLTGHVLLHGVPPPDFCEPTIHLPQELPSAEEDDAALDRFEQRAKDPFFVAYKRWRNRVRQFDPRVLFDLAIQELQTVPLKGYDVSKRLPSLTCLLVKWLLQDIDLDAIGQRASALGRTPRRIVRTATIRKSHPRLLRNSFVITRVRGRT